jgi:hypothetical protein
VSQTDDEHMVDDFFEQYNISHLIFLLCPTAITYSQNTEGGDKSMSTRQVVDDLYKQGGVGAFFDGLTPKMMRAAINHAVTFFVYANILEAVSL